jgi:hypothetical protein
LSQSSLLQAIGRGRIDRTNGLLGTWTIEYEDPRQAQSLPAESGGAENGVNSSQPADAAILESEIAALVAEAGGSLRHPDSDDCDRTPALPRPAGAPSRGEGSGPSDNIEREVCDSDRAPLAWIADIRINEPQRVASAVASPHAQDTGALLVAVLGALTIGWIVGFLSQAPGTKDPIIVAGSAAGPQAAPSVPDAGRTAPAPSVHRHRPGNTKAAAQPQGGARTSATAQQAARPSEIITSSIGRRPNLPDPVPFPETRPTTIDGWIVRDVSGGTAILEGPDGIWRATRGSTVPRVGTVESIVRWGNRWIVVTTSGLISTP